MALETKKQLNGNRMGQKIDPRNLELLGLDDTVDISVDDYKTLLREKITEARLRNTGMSTEDIQRLTDEFKKIKNATGTFKAKGKKISADSLRKKAQQVKSFKKPSNINRAKFLPSSSSNNQKDNIPEGLDDLLNDIRSEQDKTNEVLNSVLAPSFAKIEENLRGILGNTKNINESKKDSARDADKEEQKEDRKDRESELESKKSKSGVKQLQTKLKPVGNFFDMLMNFLKNILLGGALLGLVKILSNPMGFFFNPIINIINNNIIKPLNGLLRDIFGFLQSPIQGVIDGLNSAGGFIIDRINDALKLFNFDPIQGMDPIPDFEIPQIEEIKLIEPPKKESGSNQKPKVPKVQGMKGGGQVKKIKGMKGGGEISVLNYSPIVMNAYKGGGLLMSQMGMGNVGMPTLNFNGGGFLNSPKSSFNLSGNSGLGNNSFKTVSNFSFDSGGAISGSSGQTITGMGADTQLIAAQPGEIVMSKPAVNYWGKANLLAMNKQGGGTNKPRSGAISGFSGGGFVEGVKKRDNTTGPSQNKKIYLHWSAGADTNGSITADGFGYHSIFLKGGKRHSNAKYGSNYPYHTWRRNSPNAAGLAVAGNLYAMPSKTKSWGQYQVGPAAYKAMAKEAAGLAVAWGWKPSDVNSNRVMTHDEIGYKDGYGGEKWDLNRLYPGDAPNTGAQKIRGMIKSFMGQLSSGTSQVADGTKPYFEAGGAYYSKETRGFVGNTEEEAIKNTSKSDVLTGPGPLGASYSRQNNVAPSSTKTSNGAATLGSTTPSSSVPGPPRSAPLKTVFVGGGSNQKPGSKTNSSSAAQQKTVSSFSPIDNSNSELMIVKSIYNVT